MNNFIECFPQVLSPNKCDKIIRMFNKDDNKDEGKLGGRIDHALKHSIDIRCRLSNTWQRNYNDIIYPAIVSSLQLYTGKYEFMLELSSWRIYDGYNIQYYDEGQGYHALHCEHEMESPAQYRILAWMIYLNDAQCGTYYPYQDVTTTPKTGDCWIWPAFWTHAHRGVTPNLGDKYIATGWCEFSNDT